VPSTELGLQVYTIMPHLDELYANLFHWYFLFKFLRE
jgi:hypothetical protein